MAAFKTLREFFHFMNWADRELVVRKGRIYDTDDNLLAEYRNLKTN